MNDLPTGNMIAQAAFLMGDPARAGMLAALIGGEALTAGELARHVGIMPQTASGHLARLLDGHLITAERQGRHRYFRLASPSVAQVLEGLMALTSPSDVTPARRGGPRDAAMRRARTCYDHMAGRIAVEIAAMLEKQGFLRQMDGAGILNDGGHRFFCDFGIDPAAFNGSRRPLCRMCLDWSERRPHLGGQLGAALLARTIDLEWIIRRPSSRTLTITPAGERGFADLLVHSRLS